MPEGQVLNNFFNSIQFNLRSYLPHKTSYFLSTLTFWQTKKANLSLPFLHTTEHRKRVEIRSSDDPLIQRKEFFFLPEKFRKVRGHPGLRWAHVSHIVLNFRHFFLAEICKRRDASWWSSCIHILFGLDDVHTLFSKILSTGLDGKSNPPLLPGVS